MTIRYLTPPALSKLTFTSEGIKVSFSKVTGAAQYRIMRKEGSGSWKTIGTTTSASYEDKTVEPGKTYTYSVRCLDSEGNVASYYDTTGLKTRYLSNPVLTKVTNVTSGIKFTWKAVEGAVKYRVYRKEGDGSYKKLTDTTSLSYTDKTAEKDKTYTYNIRCITEDGKAFESYYSPEGLTIKRDR